MRLVAQASMLAASLLLTGSCQAPSAASGEAWFLSTRSLRASNDPELWCSFVTKVSAEAAANSERFEPTESGWLRYRGDAIESLMVISQSEDAYVEDTYTFGADLTVTEVVRKGHYVTDPFATATFSPDDNGQLGMTADSREALRSWDHTTYFFEWPFYATFEEIPFADLIDKNSGLSVSEACKEIRR